MKWKTLDSEGNRMPVSNISFFPQSLRRERERKKLYIKKSVKHKQNIEGQIQVAREGIVAGK